MPIRKITLLKERKPKFFFDNRELSNRIPIIEKPKKKGKPKELNCECCPNKEGGPVLGKGNKTGLVGLGRDPGEQEAKKKIPFIGKAGQLIRRIYNYYDLDVSQEMFLDNISQCRPKNNKFSKVAVNCCYDRLEATLKRLSPKLLITFGREATERILGVCNSIESYRCIPIPSYRYNCIVFPMYHPAYILRQGGLAEEYDGHTEEFESDLKAHASEKDYEKDIEKSIQLWNKIKKDPTYVQKFLDDRRLNYKIIKVESVEQLKRLAEKVKATKKFAIDFEGNTSKAYLEGADIFMGSIAVKFIVNNKSITYGYWFPLNDHYKVWTNEELAQIEEIICDLCTDHTIEKVIQNSKHEDHYLRRFFGVELQPPIYCTMIAKHIINSREGITGLETQAMQTFGVLYKGKTDPKLRIGKGERFNRIKEIPLIELGERCALDSIFTLNLPTFQLRDAKKNPRFEECFTFFMNGIKAFTNYEERGIKIDLQLLDELENAWRKEAKKIETKIMNIPEVKKFKRHYNELNLRSPIQVRTLLFGNEYFGLSGWKQTQKGSQSTDEEVLNSYKETNSFCRYLLQKKKVENIINTFAVNVRRFTGEDGRLHPDFWLNLASSYRSSSSSPNLQNFPKRYEVTEEFSGGDIRAVFIASNPDWELKEVDYSGNEVKGLWMLSRDDQLLEDLNAGMDMHRHWASNLYEVPEDEVTKEQRQIAKNKFVFASFYGSHYRSIAEDMQLSESHVGECQAELFSRYKGIRQWQYDVGNFYKDHGYVELLTGFRREGPLRWNQIINTPIQGSAFHLLLYSCIEIERFLHKEAGFETLTVGEIHDSILFDGPKSERDEVIELVNDVMINRVPDWAKGVLIETEWSCGKNWLDLSILSNRNGKWVEIE